jgi:hypothetical protein
MATPANIIIEFLNDSFLLPKKGDQILLFCGSDGYPFDLDGVVYLLVKAYENLKNADSPHGKHDILSPDNYASELIKLSIYTKFHNYRILPGTKLMYEQYGKEGYFVDCAYEYICNFTMSDIYSWHMSLTVKSAKCNITKLIPEWKDVCDLSLPIAYAQRKELIIMDNSLPCKECLVYGTCINKESEPIHAKKPCDDLYQYKEQEEKKLKAKLPSWSIPLVYEE